MKTRMVKMFFLDKRIRFLLVGGLNTAVGYGFYALFIFLGLDPYLAITLSTVIGVINSYFWNKYFTFRKPGKSIAEILRFVLVYAVSSCANLGLVYLFVDVLGTNPYLSGVFCLAITTLVSYLGHSFFSFRDGKKVQAG